MWLLTSVSGTHGAVNVARDHPTLMSTGFNGAWLHLSRNGTLYAGDAVNSRGARYTLVGDEMEVASGPTTFVASDPTGWAKTVVDAMDAVSGDVSPVIVGGTSSELRLTAGGYMLTFKNHGTLPDDVALTGAAPSPSQDAPPKRCPPVTLIRQITGDSTLKYVGQVSGPYLFSCSFTGAGEFDAVNIRAATVGESYDNLLHDVPKDSTVTNPGVGDRAFRAAFTEGVHPADNFVEQRGDLVLVIGVVGPAATLASELAIARFYIS